MTLYTQTLNHFLRDLNKITAEPLIADDDNQMKLAQNFWNSFDFKLIGISKFNNLFKNNRRFWNVIRSDGEAIDFIFARKKRHYTEIINHLLI